MWYFLRSTDYGIGEFLYTASLSQNMSICPSIDTTNILNFYRSDFTISAAFFNVVNSNPNVKVSTEFCHFMNHMISAMLQNTNIPVWDHLVTFSEAFLVSTKKCVVMNLPHGFGASSGIFSSASL